jgi:hypothetical protein
MAYDEKTAERVRKALSDRIDVGERRMMGGLCFMVRGRMCCSVSGKGGMLIRVAPEAHAHILREPHVSPMEMGARTMAGFVRVAPDGYRSNAALRKWVMRGVEAASARPAQARRSQGRGGRTSSRSRGGAKAPVGEGD